MPKIIDEQAENGLFKFVFTPFVERCGMLLGVWWHLAATGNETPIERVIGLPACAISVATESVPSNQLHDPRPRCAPVVLPRQADGRMRRDLFGIGHGDEQTGIRRVPTAVEIL